MSDSSNMTYSKIFRTMINQQKMIKTIGSKNACIWLALRCNVDSEGKIYLSHRDIQELTGFSNTIICKGIQKLAELGLIEIFNVSEKSKRRFYMMDIFHYKNKESNKVEDGTNVGEEKCDKIATVRYVPKKSFDDIEALKEWIKTQSDEKKLPPNITVNVTIDQSINITNNSIIKDDSEEVDVDFFEDEYKADFLRNSHILNRMRTRRK